MCKIVIFKADSRYSTRPEIQDTPRIINPLVKRYATVKRRICNVSMYGLSYNSLLFLSEQRNLFEQFFFSMFWDSF